MSQVTHWEEVPIFDSEEAEANFWLENGVDVRLMENAVASSA